MWRSGGKLMMPAKSTALQRVVVWWRLGTLKAVPRSGSQHNELAVAACTCVLTTTHDIAMFAARRYLCDDALVVPVMEHVVRSSQAYMLFYTHSALRG